MADSVEIRTSPATIRPNMVPRFAGAISPGTSIQEKQAFALEVKLNGLGEFYANFVDSTRSLRLKRKPLHTTPLKG
jgi:hypothetical protein